MGPQVKQEVDQDESVVDREDSPLISTRKTGPDRRRCFLHRKTPWALVGLAISVILLCLWRKQQSRHQKPRIAFLGNSMIYYNDLIRLLQTLSEERFEQNSCLHGGTTLTELLKKGNGMFDKFRTVNAQLNTTYEGLELYDWGSCTVPQLFFGLDDALERQVHWKTGYLVDDGLNPCLQDGRYFDYLQQQQHKRKTHWDIVFINDNTKNPGRNATRNEGLDVLEEVYVPWLLELQRPVPVFLHTHAYWAEQVDLTELASSEDDMPHFTKLTYQGYEEYSQLLKGYGLQPKIAPVGIAFLMVWEEDREFWHNLFHSDHVHASPLGTFLTACIVHHTLFDKLPEREVALIPDMPRLWERARVMQDRDDPPNPFPTLAEAEYLYEICERVAVQNEWPSSMSEF